MKRRTGWIAVAGLLLLGALVGRLWQLQIVRGEEYAALADGNRLRRLAITAPRGVIRDRHGRVLADNRLAFTVSVVPGGLQEPADGVVAALSHILQLDVEAIEQALTGPEREYPYEPIRILRDVPADVVVAIEESRMDLPGVILEQEPARRYPRAELTSHVVGHLLLPGPEDLRSFDGYRADDLVGRVGLERAYETYLRGRHGSAHVEVNALSRVVNELDSEPPEPGADLTLALDVELQKAALEALQRQLDIIAQDEDRKEPARGGAVVVLDVRSGAVLAMASVPTYDANVFLTDERSAYQALLDRDPLLPQLHRPVQGKYAPGSSFKPITYLAAVREGVDPLAVYDARGSITVAGQQICRDWTLMQGLPPAGPVNAVQAVERSVNDYFCTIGLEAGIWAIAETARSLGLGGPTGLDIEPAGLAGTVPDPDWRRTFGSGGWMPGDTANVSIGQGELEVTPLQMAMMYAGLANRGTVYRPYLVQTIHAPGGEVLLDREPEVWGELPVEERHWDVLEQGMQAVVSGERGTARHAFAGFPVAVAGKTGSAEIAAQRESHAWFAAYAPVGAPEISVAVLIEHGGGGGGNAAPVACRVLAAYFDVPVVGDGEEEPAYCP